MGDLGGFGRLSMVANYRNRGETERWVDIFEKLTRFFFFLVGGEGAGKIGRNYGPRRNLL